MAHLCKPLPLGATRALWLLLTSLLCAYRALPFWSCPVSLGMKRVVLLVEVYRRHEMVLQI